MAVTANFQRAVLLGMAGLLTASALIVASGTNYQASALSFTKAKACYTKYNDKIVAKDKYDTACDAVCTPVFTVGTQPRGDRIELPSSGSRMSCVNVLENSDLQEAASATVIDIYYGALAAKFCARASSSAADTKASNECKTILKDQVTTCTRAFYENGYEGSSKYVFPDIDKTTVANCIASKRTESARTIRNIMATVEKKAQLEGGKIQDNVINSKKKELCEDGGGTYGSDGSCTENKTSTCEVDGIGWIVCPAMKFLGTLNDQAFSQLTKLLQLEPSLIVGVGKTNPLKETWGKFRDIANVLFVIAFLVIVYGQMVGGRK